MGRVVNFAVGRLLPSGLKKLWDRTLNAISKSIVGLNTLMLIAALYYSYTYIPTWKKVAESERPKVDLVCSEFPCTRVQGIASAVALAILFFRSDPFILGMSLSILKAVSDGSVFILVLVALAIGACTGLHSSHPVTYWVLLFTLNLVYSINCYNEDHEEGGRIGGPVACASFASILIMYRVSRYTVLSTVSRMKRGAVRIGRALHILKAKED